MSSKSTIDSYELAHKIYNDKKLLEPLIIGIDPGWEGAYCYIDRAGKIIFVRDWKIKNGKDYSGWFELATVFESVIKNAVGSRNVFVAIEDTHHYGAGTNKDVSSIDRKIGMVIQTTKWHHGMVCSIPHLHKKESPELFQKQYANYMEKDIDLTKRPQHATDSCCIGLRFHRMMNAHALVIKL